MATIIELNQSNRDSVFKDACDKSYYTITGCGGDIAEWVDGYNKELGNRGIGKVETFYLFHGRDMNACYGLTAYNAYPENLTFLMFSHEGLDVPKLAMFKLAMQDRWFDDIVDNNQRIQDGIFSL